MIHSVGSRPILASVENNQIKKANQQHAKAQEIEQDKIQNMREAIKKGTYKIDLQSTSEKMALNLLNL